MRAAFLDGGGLGSARSRDGWRARAEVGVVRRCEVTRVRDDCRRVGTRALAMAVSKPPGSIKGTVSQLRDAVQQCLSSRVSRIDVELPADATFGLDKINPNASPSARTAQLRLARDELRSRELAQLVVEMFRNTGLGVAVAFNEPAIAKAAESVWSPTAAPVGSDPPVRVLHTRELSRKIVSAVEVLVCVNPKVKMLVEIKEVSQREGDRLAVLLINARLGEVRWPNANLQNYFCENFVSALFYKMLESDDPERPKASGTVLYRKFPDDWALCQKRSFGAPAVLASWPQRPEDEQLAAKLRDTTHDRSNGPGSGGLLDSVASFFRK